MGSLAEQDIKGVMDIVLLLSCSVSSALVAIIAGTVQPNAQYHRKEGPSGKPHLSHNAIHNIGYPCHIAAVLQNGKRQEQDKNIRDKGKDTSHTRYDSINNQGNHPVSHMQSGHSCSHQLRYDSQRIFQSTLQEIANKKGKKKYQRHNAQEYRHAPNGMGQHLIYPVRARRFPVLVKKHFLDDFFYIFVFLFRDILFIIAIYNAFHFQRMILFTSSSFSSSFMACQRTEE